MKKVLIPAAVLLLALTGCAAQGDKAPTAQATEQPKQESITVDSTKALAYACGPQGKEKITVQYGIKNNDLVVAIVNFRNQDSPLLRRDSTDTQHNTFTGGRVIWSTDKATLATVDKAKVGGLAQVDQDGKAQILASACKLDKKATAALAKAAAQSPAAQAQ